MHSRPFGQRFPAPPHPQPTSSPAPAEDLEALLGPRPYRSNELRNIDKFREGFNKDGPGGKVGTRARGTQPGCLPADKHGPQLQGAPGRPATGCRGTGWAGKAALCRADSCCTGCLRRG